MTPQQEKARELYKKYLEWVSPSYYLDGTYNKQQQELAKQCEIICVDEIIKTLNQPGLKNNNLIKFWQQVKQEILNLN